MTDELSSESESVMAPPAHEPTPTPSLVMLMWMRTLLDAPTVSSVLTKNARPWITPSTSAKRMGSASASSLYRKPPLE